MDVVRRICQICAADVDVTHYARHIKSHKAKFQCKLCPSLTFNRRDNYMRHLKVHGSSSISNNEATPQPIIKRDIPISTTRLIIDEEQLNEHLANFSVDIPNFANQKETSNLIHPFSCKIVGPRGSAKTCFTISYIQKIACYTFDKIFIVSASLDQPLYGALKNNNQIYFVTLEELEVVVESHKDSLIILDDVMQEARYNNTLETIFTNGRHLRISVMSLEQDLFYSNPTERRNVDYYILMKMRDTSSLIQFYKRFCSDIQQWRFIDIYEHSVAQHLGYLIIDFVSHKFKYRINSLNLYFELQTMTIEYVKPTYKSTERNISNTQLQEKFQHTIADFNVRKNYNKQTPKVGQTKLCQRKVGQPKSGHYSSNDDE